MGRFAEELDVDVKHREALAPNEVARGRMDHHGRVHVFKDPSVNHDNLATASLLGWRADDSDLTRQIGQHGSHRQPGTHRRRGDQVMAAGVPQARQGVVFGQKGNSRPFLAPSQRGDEGCVQPSRTALHIQSVSRQGIAQQFGRRHLLKTQFRIGVNLVGDVDQIRPERIHGGDDTPF
jgi:hypothetical protein